MSKNRYYYYDHESCAFIEVRPTRAKRYVQGGALLVASLLLAGVFTWVMDGMTYSPQEQALLQENVALQQKLAETGRRMKEFSKHLEQLSSADQTLYRTLLQADPISPGVRRVGVGGSDPYEKYSRYSASTSSMLRNTSEMLDAIERQISLQNTSYRELAKLAGEREERLAHMPALLPTDGPVVSGYGMRRHPILRVRKMHHGIDVLVPVGTSVVATADGVVREAQFSPTYGFYVKIEHEASGYSTLYAHLSEIRKGLRPGRRVNRGEEIGVSGSTGRSSGPHLHYEVRDDDGSTMNPVYFFAPNMTPHAYQKLLKEAEESTIALD